MHRFAHALLLVAAFAVLLPAAARADGISFVGHDMDFRGPLTQEMQRAFLSLHDGTEHMLITINVAFEEDDLEGFWIFPVPGTPETVTVDLLDRFPAMRGVDPIEGARHGLSSGVITEIALVINPVLGVVSLLPAMVRVRSSDAEVHSTVERHGLLAEKITALSAKALGDYLAKRGIKVPERELGLFAPYLNDRYVLIVTSIASTQKLREAFPDEARWGTQGGMRRWPALYVTFPAEKLYYPMRPTAGYGDREMMVSIATVGHTKPQGDAAMLAEARCRHYIQRTVERDAFPKGMLAGLARGEPFRYSRVTFYCPTSRFTSDLTFGPNEDALSRTRIALARPLGLPIVKFFVLLFVSGGACGVLYLREWWRPAFYGLLGFLSFPVVSHMTWRDVVPSGQRLPRVSAFTYALSFLALFIVLDLAVTRLLLAFLRV